MINTCITRVPGCCEAVTAQCVVGDTISNNLILTEHVAASAGRAIIDFEEKDKEMISATCSLFPYMKPTSIVEASSKEYGTYRGMLKKFSITISRKKGGVLSARTNIEIEKVKT